MNREIDSRLIDTVGAAFREGDENVANKLEEADNVRRVEEVLRIITRKDFKALDGILADDVTLEIIGSPDTPMAGLTQGCRQVIERLENNFAQIEEQQPEIQSVVAQGNTVVVIGRDRGRFRPTGRAYDMHWMHQYTFKGDKIIRLRELFDSAALLNVI